MKLTRLLQACLCFGYCVITTGLADNRPELTQHLPRSIVIVNSHMTHSIRCQFVLAHFVTYDFVKVLPNDTLSIPVILRQSDRTIFYVYSGKHMAVEDLFCGLDAHWSSTRTELTLTPLQSMLGESLGFDCGLDRDLFCTYVTPED